MLDGCTPWPEEFVDRYWAAGHWRGSTLDNLLRGWALRYGPRTALVHGAGRLTYAGLNRRADRAAAGFRLRGLRAGQRVLVQLPNVPEAVVTLFALMRAGVVPVICPVSLRTPEVSHLVRVARAVGYVGPSTREGFDHTAMAADIAAREPFLRRVFTYEPPGVASPYGGLTTDPSGCHYCRLDSIDAPPEPPLAPDAGQVAFFLLSDDDATAAPRLVPRTHNDYACQVRAAAELVALTGDDVYLAALPDEFNLTFGCPGILGTLAAGGTVVLAEDPDPAVCLPLVARERVTVTSVVPAVARAWLDALPAARTDTGSLRLVQIGGTASDGTAAAGLGAAWGCRLQRVSGRAEGPLTLTRPDDPAGTVHTTRGRPLSPDDEVRIVDADGRDVPRGGSGELLVRGPCTPRGYYRAPDHNARAFTGDGYLRTGDLARLTPAGDLVATGRLDRGPDGGEAAGPAAGAARPG
ncbi:2,3-dihydroxybenzoate-AMP ligase [Streptomyces subrutilus]|uniref:2,3-dihydroxybenzoate-AMP ligase n=1 Tax=Streptomyces subrutilus TaxID=36818 RepID=A0A5P2UMQ5_9ACTN|nr:AMP-binding protein [Streptomyces subrutilus]QEU80160.1 2,3-dihydroxybenzoyl adenylate synthase [Streptomyces subrutilus]GGZ50114.1 2,3-dihydroxybenzoate-AMP ligase [Streptomyces subrutilus]